MNGDRRWDENAVERWYVAVNAYGALRLVHRLAEPPTPDGPVPHSLCGSTRRGSRDPARVRHLIAQDAADRLDAQLCERCAAKAAAIDHGWRAKLRTAWPYPYTGPQTWPTDVSDDPPPEAGETAQLSPCCGLPVPTALDPEHGETCDTCYARAVEVAERST